MEYKFKVTDLEKFIHVKNNGKMTVKNYLRKSAGQLPDMMDKGKPVNHFLRLRKAYLQGGMDLVQKYFDWVNGKVEKAIAEEKKQAKLN